MLEKKKKIVKSSIINISDNAASKKENRIFDRAVFAKGDGWKI